MSGLMRRAILAVAGNPAVAAWASRHGLKMGARRFVAGETLEQAIEVSRRINGDGRAVTLDLLGEDIREADQTRVKADACLAVLEAISREGIDGNLSVKLTQLGLDISSDLCHDNLRRIAGRARDLGNFVRIDMESSAHTEPTLRIFKTLRREFSNVGLALQAYLFRSETDLLSLQKLGANIRLVKGAYNEPPEVAYQSKEQVDANFNRLISLQLESGCYTAVATHDHRAIAFALDYVGRRGISRDCFEFQMLYGIRTARQIELARAGYRTRVYVPFGKDWYPYFVRRLVERPANLWFVLKNLLPS